MQTPSTTSNTISPQRTQSQDRAAYAWDCIAKIKNSQDGAGKRKEYKSLVRGSGAYIMTSGLGQTLAFLRAKGKPEHLALFKHLNDWLKKKLALRTDVHLWIMDAQTSSDAYRHATRESLDYLVWLKRFAEAELADDTNPVA